MPVTHVPDMQASLREWAQWYAAHSWPVIPMHTPGSQGCSCQEGLRCKHPGKHPRTAHGRNDASTNQQTIADWWHQWPEANIAIRTDTLCILDIDLRHNGHISLRSLEAQYGQLPDGPRVLSGSGGEHYYFALPADGVGIPSSNGLVAPGIDIKGFHENINVPPSLHASGNRYEWDGLFSLDAFDVQSPPQWLVDLARQARPVTTQTYEAGVTIPEGSRYQYLIGVAGRSRFNGFSESQIYDALQIANQNCQPPEDDKALREYAKWASRKDMADPHTLTPATMTGVKPLASSACMANQMASPSSASSNNTHAGATAWGTPPILINFDDAVNSRSLLKMMMVPPRFLISKLIPDGLTILSAPAKSYKSYFALSLALATIGEGDWCDVFPVEETGNVVFFGLEAPLMQLRNRIHQLRPAYNADTCPHELIFFSGMKALPTFKNGLHDAIKLVIEHYSPRLIVIDPLSYLYRMGRQDDLATATVDLLWPLAEMAASYGIALFAPEHMRKRSKEDVSVVDQLNGSYIKAAVVHSLLSIERQGEDIIIKTNMRDAANQELALTLEFDETHHKVIWGYKGSNALVTDARNSMLKSEVLAELQARSYPMKVAEVLDALVLKNMAKNTPHTKDQIRQILHRAERENDVAVSKRGEYYWIGTK